MCFAPALALLAAAPRAAGAMPPAAGEEQLPELLLTRDDTEVERSVRVRIPAGTVIEDAAGDGVLRVVADGVRIEFAPGSVLRGAPAGTPWDALAGEGVRVEGRREVTLSGLVVAGYRVGVHAIAADGLVVEDADVSDNFRQRLGSTPEAEDSADWLWPHANDGGEWLSRYGAGIAIERSRDVVVRRSRARRVQNGLILDRVSAARVYDNDFSFLSGWGIALWRTSDSVISRNALDFCVRGYSHGVYNRGQDSAGLLVFEQSCRNLVAQNSITHGGDGVFGFAGKEALGEAPAPQGFSHRRAGCNDNVFVGNDLSFAAAHGLEMTFSFGNVVRANRFIENAICGIWGGYSRETWIEGNEFARNGDAGYGLERGGVDIEHGQRNVIRGNRFRENACGVHLWWDADEGLSDTPWARANGTACRDEHIVGNRFEGDRVAIHLRHARGAHVADNRFEAVGAPVEVEGDPPVAEAPLPDPPPPLELEALGETRPVGARADLGGREAIVVGPFGPWDHAEPLLVAVQRRGSEHRWRLLGAGEDARITLEGARLEREPRPDGALDLVITPEPAHALAPYRLEVDSGERRLVGSGTLLEAEWRVTVFPWSVDPREDPAAWRAQANGEGARSFTTDELRLEYGMGGPAAVAPAGGGFSSLPADRFGTIARTRLPLPPGTYRLRVRSDDGVRVRVAGEVVLEDWTWHAPREAQADFTVPADGGVEIEVEHFELDGYATLVVELAIDCD